VSTAPQAAADPRSTRWWAVRVLLALLVVLPLFSDHGAPPTTVGAVTGASALVAPQCPQHDAECRPLDVPATAAASPRLPLPDTAGTVAAAPAAPGAAPPTGDAPVVGAPSGAQLLLTIGISRT